ncbi:MAG: carbohydrate ABC transporter permease [Clostridiaceae bacterium]|jgi:raffinose/stachyose/melibiose transport system permease protein|nr:carbohydrate ABC transporter permease [Clostridiaceae bacterium]
MDSTAAAFEKQISKTKVKNVLSRVLIYSVLILWAFSSIYMLFWVVNNSFREKTEILNDSFSFVTYPTDENYRTAFGRLSREENMSILRAYLNSVIISGSTVICVTVLGGLAAYAMARYSFKLKNVLYLILAGSLLFPAYSLIVPIFRMIQGIGLVNNPIGVIIPQTAVNLAFSIIILMGFIKNLPTEIEEAAYMEGCGVFSVFFRIILPVTKPAFATVGIFTFLWSYNDLFLQMSILRKRVSYPVSALLNEISSQFGTDFGLMCSATTIVVLPILIIYLFLQKNIMKGLTAGAIKG